MIDLEVVMQQGCMSGMAADCNTLLEHVQILHVNANPELESVLLGHELRDCVLQGLAQALEEIVEAHNVFVCGEALQHLGPAEGSLCVHAGEEELNMDGSRLLCA